MKTCLSKYADFTGRAARPEFWWFALFYLGMFFVVAVIGEILLLSPNTVDGLLGITWLALLLPSLAVGVRRLHDTDRSGWWWLISFVPFVGGLVLLVFWASSGTAGPNRFGPPPR